MGAIARGQLDSLLIGHTAERVLERNQDTRPVSGRQELLENLLNRYI